MDLLEEAEKRADDAELYAVESEVYPVSFKSGQVESAKSVYTTGRALRVVKDGRLGFSSTTNLNDGNLVDRALSSAKFGDQVSFRFPAKDEYDYDYLEAYDKSVESLTIEDLIERARTIIEPLEDYDSRLQIDLDISKGANTTTLVNTSGLALEERRSQISVSVQVQQVKEEDIFTIWASDSARREGRIDYASLTQQLIQRLRWAERTAAVPQGHQPAVFTPRGAMVLLLPLMVGLNGKNVYLESSPLTDSLGEEVFDSRFSLIDDGRCIDSSVAQTFDDEGVPTSRKKLVDAGTVKKFLYDLKTATRSATKPTGNGYKSGIVSDGDFRSVPDAGPSSLFVQEGGRSFGELIQSIEDGILVDQVLGLGQGNVISGEFSNNVAVGYRIKDGSLTGKVKDTMIAGNAYELLGDSLRGIGQVSEWVGGQICSPPIAVDNLSVVQQSA